MKVLANFSSFIESLSGKEAIRQKSEFDDVYSTLVDKAVVTLNFGDIPIDFKAGKDWEKFKEHSLGDIRFRDFYSKDSVVSSHNFWAENATIFEHYHSNADTFIYLIHGLLEVIVEGEVKNVHPDKDNPFHIPLGLNHSIRSIETSVFVIKFVISQK